MAKGREAQEEVGNHLQVRANPLAHSLGMGKKSDWSIEAAKCKKDKDNNVVAWTDQELDAIERSDDLDNFPVTLKRSGKKWSLIVEHFYLGLFKLLRKLAKDKTQMLEAKKRFASGKFVWHK